MTTLRRTFDAPVGQILVTVHVETGEVQCATRPDGWDQWTVPLPEIDRQDDVEPGRLRHAYDTGDMVVVPLVEGPHSRACGVWAHPHGRDCHANCPTCGGRPISAT